VGRDGEWEREGRKLDGEEEKTGGDMLRTLYVKFFSYSAFDGPNSKRVEERGRVGGDLGVGRREEWWKRKERKEEGRRYPFPIKI